MVSSAVTCAILCALHVVVLIIAGFDTVAFSTLCNAVHWKYSLVMFFNLVKSLLRIEMSVVTFLLLPRHHIFLQSEHRSTLGSLQ